MYGEARIKVVGVGGGGVNAVRRIAASGLAGVDTLCVNTDVASLGKAAGVPALAIGSRLTGGRGAGGNPDVGRRAAEDTQPQLEEWLQGSDLVIVAAGMGGGTGTGAAPVVAALARKAGALTVAVVTTPFQFEGIKRSKIAAAGLQPLLAAADTAIVVSNQRLLTLAQRRTSVMDSFAQADQVMVRAIEAFSRVIHIPGDINVDFADIRAIASDGGLGVVAVGRGNGTHRLLKAARSTVENPLMDKSAHGAQGLLFSVTAGYDLRLTELNDAGAFLAGVADPEAQIIFGVHMDPQRTDTDDVETVLIATRLPEDLPDGEAAPKLTIAEKVRLATAHYYADGELPAFLREMDIS